MYVYLTVRCVVQMHASIHVTCTCAYSTVQLWVYALRGFKCFSLSPPTVIKGSFHTHFSTNGDQGPPSFPMQSRSSLSFWSPGSGSVGRRRQTGEELFKTGSQAPLDGVSIPITSTGRQAGEEPPRQIRQGPSNEESMPTTNTGEEHSR
jgi:hypothetical protein